MGIIENVGNVSRTVSRGQERLQTVVVSQGRYCLGY